MSKPSRKHHNPVATIEHEEHTWEAVWDGASEADATIVAGGLEADGFRAHISGAHGLPAYGGYRVVGDEWAVFVRDDKADEARQLLRRRGHGAEVVSDGSSLGMNARFAVQALVTGVLGLVVFLLYLAIRSQI
jgi:hypothetical protein